MKLTRSLLISALVAVVVSVSISYVMKPSQASVIKTVDLGKIINAQMLLGSRALNSELASEPWMASISDASQDLAAVIEEVAGTDALVIVTPAVVQGAQDITREVLIHLGLPTNIPDYDIRQEHILPSAIDTVFDGDEELAQRELEQANDEDEWLMP